MEGAAAAEGALFSLAAFRVFVTLVLRSLAASGLSVGWVAPLEGAGAEAGSSAAAVMAGIAGVVGVAGAICPDTEAEVDAGVDTGAEADVEADVEVDAGEADCAVPVSALRPGAVSARSCAADGPLRMAGPPAMDPWRLGSETVMPATGTVSCRKRVLPDKRASASVVQAGSHPERRLASVNFSVAPGSSSKTPIAMETATVMVLPIAQRKTCSGSRRPTGGSGSSSCGGGTGGKENDEDEVDDEDEKDGSGASMPGCMARSSSVGSVRLS